jgi:hypothetical protein
VLECGVEIGLEVCGGDWGCCEPQGDDGANGRQPGGVEETRHCAIVLDMPQPVQAGAAPG